MGSSLLQQDEMDEDAVEKLRVYLVLQGVEVDIEESAAPSDIPGMTNEADHGFGSTAYGLGHAI